MADRTAVYRIFGDADLLLYVGVSKVFGARWQNHGRSQPWWDEHRKMTIEWYSSRPLAEAAEATVIEAEEPKYNIKPGVIVIDEEALALPPESIRDDLGAVADWILNTPRLPPAEIRLALARPLQGPPPTNAAAFVAYAERNGVSRRQAYEAARRRRLWAPEPRKQRPCQVRNPHSTNQPPRKAEPCPPT